MVQRLLSYCSERAQQIKRGVFPSPFAALSAPISERFQFTAELTGEFSTCQVVQP